MQRLHTVKLVKQFIFESVHEAITVTPGTVRHFCFFVDTPDDIISLKTRRDRLMDGGGQKSKGGFRKKTKTDFSQQSYRALHHPRVPPSIHPHVIKHSVFLHRIRPSLYSCHHCVPVLFFLLFSILSVTSAICFSSF